MPLTSAEKSRRYREKLKKENPEKYEQTKLKSRQRSSRQYERKTKDLDENKKQSLIEEWRRRYAEKKKKTGSNSEEQEIVVQNVNAGTNSSEQLITKTQMKRIRRNVTNVLRRENSELKARVTSLEKGLNTVRRQLREIKQTFLKPKDLPVTSVDNNIPLPKDDTPIKRSQAFVETYLQAVDTPTKDIVKKKVFEMNVLTDSLQKTYKTANNNIERQVLKEIVDNDFVRKYRVTNVLTQNLGLKSSIRETKTTKKISEDLKNKIRTFYERDDVSRASAGKKECVTKKKIKKQKRYLIDKLRNLHQKYVSEVGTISFTTFKKHRPFYVVAPNLKNLETCVCLKHANMQFIINALTSAGVFEKTDLNMVISSLVCDLSFKGCMYGECDICSQNCIAFVAPNDNIVKWFAWTFKDYTYNEKGTVKLSKRMAKVEKNGSITELLDLFHANLKSFKIHIFNVRHQYQQYKSCIQHLEINEVAIHVDFSENWVAKYNEEVQAMHFGASKTQITLHTGVFYIKNANPFSFCTISENNYHGPEAIWEHLKVIISYIQSEYTNIDTFHFFSDGPTTQYRQKKNFYLLGINMENSKATWSFFEASHGKGAADGIGGSIKRALDFKVSHGLDIPDAKAAFDALQTDSSIKTFLVPPETIQPLNENLVKKLQPIRNTMKIHQLITISKHSLKHRILSCFCQNLKGKCECFDPQLHNFDCLDNNFENEDDFVILDEVTGEITKRIKHNNPITDNLYEETEWLPSTSAKERREKTSTKRKINDTFLPRQEKRKRMTAHDSIDSTDEDDAYSVHDSSESDFDGVATDCDDDLNNRANFKNTNMNTKIDLGTYVLVKFDTEKTTKYYIGEVIELCKSYYKVKFLRNKGKGKFAWPSIEDTSVVYKPDIAQIIQKPLSERRGIKTFNIQHLSMKIE